MKGGQEVQQNLVMVFLKKNSSGQMGQFGQKNDVLDTNLDPH